MLLLFYSEINLIPSILSFIYPTHSAFFHLNVHSKESDTWHEFDTETVEISQCFGKSCFISNALVAVTWNTWPQQNPWLFVLVSLLHAFLSLFSQNIGGFPCFYCQIHVVCPNLKRNILRFVTITNVWWGMLALSPDASWLGSSSSFQLLDAPIFSKKFVSKWEDWITIP